MKKFIAGMAKDLDRVDQPEGTYRDALNVNLYYQKGAIVNEHGTLQFTGTTPENIIGSCALKDGRLVVFYNTVNTSRIAIADPATNIVTDIYQNVDLNFQPSNTIEATSKIDVNGNVLVYFTDNYIKKSVEEETGIEYIVEYNPPRVINITRQEQSSINLLYGNSDYTVSKLDLFMNAGFIPEFKNARIEEGGGVVSGTYHLALAYVDEDLNRTNYLTVSNPVHLVTAAEDSIPTEIITGDPQGSQSNKSITWEIEIPAPSNYTHVQPVVIQRFGGGQNQESSEFAYELQIVKIPEEQNDVYKLDITYTGLEQVTAGNITEVVVDSVRYETAKTFVQLDGRLYISNLKSRGDIGYQRFANSIELEPVIKKVEKFDPKRFNSIILNRGYFNSQDEGNSILLKNDFDIYKNLQQNNNDPDFLGAVRKGYKDVNMSYKYRGYRRSEVYAFYISFVLKDGTETYAYHIPGREKVEFKVDETQSLLDEPAMIDINLNPIAKEFRQLFPEGELYQMIDTELLDPSVNMSYWENKDETYPVTDDFTVWTSNDEGTPLEITDIQSQNVRHHKMPSNKGDFQFIATTPDISPSLNDNIDYALTMREQINILGVKFKNIPLPKFIRDQVQGFKIYYAKRSQENKTIIGQSVVLPAWYESPIAFTTDPELAAFSTLYDAWMLKGHIPIHPRFYPEITNSPYENTEDAIRGSKAINTFSFHDFNMLKNKHTLSGATHIDVQKMLVMRPWIGGPKNKLAQDKDYFRDIEWSSTDIGYAWSYYNEDESAWELNTTSKVEKYFTSVMIAQEYANPYSVGNVFLRENNIPNNYSTILTIEPNSKTYVPGGKTIIKNSESMAYSNVDYISNYAGESCMLFGLSSGLPVLYGYTRHNVSQNLIWFNYEFWSSGEYVAEGTDGNNELQANNVTKQLLPALYLVNLCAYKTNVYKPFDQQRLVWTGYYQPIASKPNAETEYVVETESVFGGDTYISRYGFRHTSEDYTFSFDKDYDKINPPLLPNISGASYSDPKEWKAGKNNPYSSIYYFWCETDDLLGYRHQQDQNAGVNIDDGMFFEASIASKVLFNGPLHDNTKMENLLYMNNYSAVQDIKVTVPLPKKLFNPTSFPTRTIRSTVDDGSIQDKYRFFLSLDYKDIPRYRGEITNIFTLSSILYVHTERSLFVTRGRQQLGLSDGSQAFVGNGDVFEQNPDEMIPTTEGYGGTDSQFASLTTRYGQFFINRKDRKVYMLGEGIEEISALGMERWFLDNIPYAIENYIDIEAVANLDSPTEYFGFTAAYDPKFKRIVLSKKEKIPTFRFINLIQGATDFQSVDGGISFYSEKSEQTETILFSSDYFTDGGWTVSFYPELKVWGSRHSYIPTLFENNQQELYSLVNKQGVFEHSNDRSPGNFYGVIYPSEFEFIDNQQAGASKIFTNIRFWTSVQNFNGDYPKEFNRHTMAGFDEFYVYNSHQLSGRKPINYLTNARLVDKFWYINDFRDMSKMIDNTSEYLVTNIPNVQNDVTQSVSTSQDTVSMFTSEGIINDDYLDLNKHWFNQKKFVDHYLGVRLINNNESKNLVYLYAAGTKFRQSFR